MLSAEVRAEGLTRITFPCSPYHANSALYPVIEHFRRLARWQPEDGVGTRISKLEALLGRYSQPLTETVPPLAALLSLPLPEDRYPPLELTPQQQKQQIQDMLIALTRGGRAPASPGSMGRSALGRPVDPGAAQPADRAGADRLAADGPDRAT